MYNDEDMSEIKNENKRDISCVFSYVFSKNIKNKINQDIKNRFFSFIILVCINYLRKKGLIWRFCVFRHKHTNNGVKLKIDINMRKITILFLLLFLF